jgi:hypothetical protein
LISCLSTFDVSNLSSFLNSHGPFFLLWSTELESWEFYSNFIHF